MTIILGLCAKTGQGDVCLPRCFTVKHFLRRLTGMLPRTDPLSQTLRSLLHWMLNRGGVLQ